MVTPPADQDMAGGGALSTDQEYDIFLQNHAQTKIYGPYLAMVDDCARAFNPKNDPKSQRLRLRQLQAPFCATTQHKARRMPVNAAVLRSPS